MIASLIARSSLIAFHQWRTLARPFHSASRYSSTLLNTISRIYAYHSNHPPNHPAPNHLWQSLRQQITSYPPPANPPHGIRKELTYLVAVLMKESPSFPSSCISSIVHLYHTCTKWNLIHSTPWIHDALARVVAQMIHHHTNLVEINELLQQIHNATLLPSTADVINNALTKLLQQNESLSFDIIEKFQIPLNDAILPTLLHQLERSLSSTGDKLSLSEVWLHRFYSMDRHSPLSFARKREFFLSACTIIQKSLGPFDHFTADRLLSAGFIHSPTSLYSSLDVQAIDCWLRESLQTLVRDPSFKSALRFDNELRLLLSESFVFNRDFFTLGVFQLIKLSKDVEYGLEWKRILEKKNVAGQVKSLHIDDVILRQVEYTDFLNWNNVDKVCDKVKFLNPPTGFPSTHEYVYNVAATKLVGRFPREVLLKFSKKRLFLAPETLASFFHSRYHDKHIYSLLFRLTSEHGLWSDMFSSYFPQTEHFLCQCIKHQPALSSDISDLLQDFNPSFSILCRLIASSNARSISNARSLYDSLNASSLSPSQKSELASSLLSAYTTSENLPEAFDFLQSTTDIPLKRSVLGYLAKTSARKYFPEGIDLILSHLSSSSRSSSSSGPEIEGTQNLGFFYNDIIDAFRLAGLLHRIPPFVSSVPNDMRSDFMYLMQAMYFASNEEYESARLEMEKMKEEKVGDRVSRDWEVYFRATTMTSRVLVDSHGSHDGSGERVEEEEEDGGAVGLWHRSVMLDRFREYYSEWKQVRKEEDVKSAWYDEYMEYLKPLDVVSFTSALFAYGHAGQMNTVPSLLSLMRRKNVLPDVGFLTTLAVFRSLHGDVSGSLDAISQLSEIKSPPQSIFNAIIGAFARTNNVEGALEWFQKLRRQIPECTVGAYIALNNFHNLDHLSIDDAQRLCLEIEKIRLPIPPGNFGLGQWTDDAFNSPSSPFPFSSSTHPHPNHRRRIKSMKVKPISTPGIQICNALIFAYARHGLVSDALSTLKTMSQWNRRPDMTSYTGLMVAYSVKNHFDGVLSLWSYLRESIGVYGVARSRDGIWTGENTKWKVKVNKRCLKVVMECVEKGVAECVENGSDDVDEYVKMAVDVVQGGIASFHEPVCEKNVRSVSVPTWKGSILHASHLSLMKQLQNRTREEVPSASCIRSALHALSKIHPDLSTLREKLNANCTLDDAIIEFNDVLKRKIDGEQCSVEKKKTVSFTEQ